MLVLDAAIKAPAVPGFEVVMTSELQWVANRPVTDLLRYRAESHPLFRHGPRGSAAAVLPQYLELPPGFNPRTLALAQRDAPRPAPGKRRPARPGPGRAASACAPAATTTRWSPAFTATHTADEFWFDRKEGFCEHIASAFVVLMRAMDIPARLVTGYQGGERNPVDGFWIVRQSDAHAWTEVWLAGQGWVRVDPDFGALRPGAPAPSSACKLRAA